MRSTVVQKKPSKRFDEAHSSSSDLQPPLQTKSAMSEKENDWAADFLIGALLYSLFSSSKSQAVSGLLPDEEQN